MRISDNTSKGAVDESIKRSRSRMERLQVQNSAQKKVLAPSDDPAANSKLMDIRTQTTVNGQFESNGVLAKNRLSMTDSALGELYDLFVRAKEIAISQSSDASASADSRLGVAQEVSALYQQLVSIANRRVGQHFLFGGFKTQSAPYTPEGQYKGDGGEIPIEVQKDVFIAVNVPGTQVFESKLYTPEDAPRANLETDSTGQSTATPQRGPAGGPAGPPRPRDKVNAFHELDSLRVALLTNDTISIRDSLERFDEVIKNLVTVRAKVSSRVSGIDSAIGSTQRIDLQNAELASQLEDADYAELWSNLAKEETVMRSSLQAAQKLIQPTLLEFLR